MKFKIRLERFEAEQAIKASHIKMCRIISYVFVILLIISAIIAYRYLMSENKYGWIWLVVIICSACIIAVCKYSIDVTNNLYQNFKSRVYDLSDQVELQKNEKEQLIKTREKKEADFKESQLKEKEQFIKQYEKKEADYKESQKKEKEQLIKQYEEKVLLLKETIKTKSPFSIVANMYSDWETVVFKDAEHYLINKQPPAPKAAETVSEFRKKAQIAIMENKVMEYKYMFLLDAFPELKLYIDDEESVIHIEDYQNYDEFRSEGDEVLEFLDIEEYRRLSVTERNQLALERYKARNKSNWEIGMEYEMYIGYLLRNHKFQTIQYGIENGLSDLGRDIIAERAHLDGSRTIYIIQCKRWSEHRQLHENVVCQLYGTKIEYEIQHQHFMNTTVIPVLVTTTDLSDTAMEFAKRLKVVVKKVEMGEYPMIKCNINGDNRIYHLPFDQQYYRTQITNQGEFYAWTVKEAENAGFRRARRHLV